MPRYAANLAFLFKELPFLDRFAEAKAQGFDAVELPFPYDEPIPEIVDRLALNELKLVLVNTPPPNYTGGARGFAAAPSGEQRFQHDFRRSLRYAGRLKPAHIHIMAGQAEGAEARETYLRNLAWAAAAAPKQSLTIEPNAPSETPGCFLADFETAAEVIAEVGAPNLRLQFDAYHAQLITGDACAAWERYGKLAGHVQIAGVPGRHEPVKGKIDYPAFLAALDASGYTGWVGCEYVPTGKTTAAGLGWRG